MSTSGYPPPPPPPPPGHGGSGPHGSSPPAPATGDGPIASVSERIGARFIDAAVWFVFAGVLAALQAILRAVLDMPDTPDGDALSGFFGLATFSSFVAYDAVTTKYLGNTPGKRVVGLRVVRAGTLEPLRPAALGGRSFFHLMLWLFLVPGPLNVMAASSSPRKQGWHDRAMNSVVLRSSAPSAPSAAPVASGPWQTLAAAAEDASTRFDRATAAGRKGPITTRLQTLRREIDACVEECKRVAARGAEVTTVADGVDVDAIEERSRRATDDAAAHPADKERRLLAEALAAEAASARRVHELVATTERKLQRLVSRLNDSVNRAIELVYDSSDDGRFERLVDDLSALQAGLAEVEGDMGSASPGHQWRQDVRRPPASDPEE